MGIPPANRLPGCGAPPPNPPPDVKALEGGPLDPFDPPKLLGVSTWGALRSLVSVCFNFLPAWICFKSSLEAMSWSWTNLANNCAAAAQSLLLSHLGRKRTMNYNKVKPRTNLLAVNKVNEKKRC